MALRACCRVVAQRLRAACGARGRDVVGGMRAAPPVEAHKHRGRRWHRRAHRGV